MLNRANSRQQIFETPADYISFERILEQALDHVPMRILSYCVMPNHWHLVLWPVCDGDLSRFVGWLTLTHTQRWHAHRSSAGTGHLYQGRFKSFVVSSDRYFLTVCRYVEQNPRRAMLVRRAEQWQWSSLWRRTFGAADAVRILSDWPLERPRNWVSLVNELESDRKLEALRHCVNRGKPFGPDEWVANMVERLSLASTIRSRGRPKG